MNINEKNAENSVYDFSCRERFVEENHFNTWRCDFERDRARVIHSSGLRRLEGKTQVVAPQYDDFTRTRLTHSLEVAQIGRALANFLGVNPDIVDTACLAHDIGHPPYGHNGETALNEVAKHIGGFEGNAQTFRLLVRLEPKIFRNNKNYGLNLTRAVLDATCKYPWSAKNPPKLNDEKAHKFGVYEDDLKIFNWMRKETVPYKKCIEAQIMDLSDDIAYCVHDLEDSVKIGGTDLQKLYNDAIIQKIVECTSRRYKTVDSQKELFDAFERLLKKFYWMSKFDGSYTDLASLKNMTSELISHFCVKACESTKDNNKNNLLGRYFGEIVVPKEILAEIEILKGIAAYNIMVPLERKENHKWEQKILIDLFEYFTENPNSSKYLDPIFKFEWDMADEYGKHRVIVDQLASLTDSSAKSMYEKIIGCPFLY